MVVIGEKGRAQLVRDRRKSIIATIQEVGKIRMTFTQVDVLLVPRRLLPEPLHPLPSHYCMCRLRLGAA